MRPLGDQGKRSLRGNAKLIHQHFGRAGGFVDLKIKGIPQHQGVFRGGLQFLPGQFHLLFDRGHGISHIGNILTKIIGVYAFHHFFKPGGFLSRGSCFGDDVI